MLNIIWLLMIVVGVAIAFVNGCPQLITKAAIEGAGSAVELVIEMTGVIMLWLGVLRLAEKSGLVAALGRLLSPLLRRLFPALPKDSAAFGSIIMNVSANLLGLGNAATPFGIKAMQELQKLNTANGRSRSTASDEMVVFLILNTSAVTLIPTMVLGLRVEAGAAAPEEIIFPALLAGLAGLTAGLLCHWLLKRFF